MGKTKAIVTYAAGDHTRLLEISLPTFQAFATAHGYELIVGDKRCDRPPAWNKIPLLLDALDKFDEVVWFDCDLMIVDPSEDLPTVPAKYSHALVRHFTAGSEVPNTGMWLLRQEAKAILSKAWDLEVFMNHGWWEQAAVLTLMGYTVPPQGTVFDETKCECVFPTVWRERAFFFPVQWNSHPNYQAEKARIVHCSYPDPWMRMDTMRGLAADPGFAYQPWPSDEDDEDGDGGSGDGKKKKAKVGK